LLQWPPEFGVRTISYTTGPTTKEQCTTDGWRDFGDVEQALLFDRVGLPGLEVIAQVRLDHFESPVDASAGQAEALCHS